MRREPTIERDVKRGDIYWINPSPYKGNGDHVQRAGRPGIIVSNDKINDTGNTYEIVYLTTKPKRDCDTHVTIRSSYKTSTALCEQVQTISSEQLGRYVGACTVQEMEAVERSIMTSLDLDMRRPKPDFEPRLAELRLALIKAEGEADLYHRLYEELMEKMIRIAAK